MFPDFDPSLSKTDQILKHMNKFCIFLYLIIPLKSLLETIRRTLEPLSKQPEFSENSDI